MLVHCICFLLFKLEILQSWNNITWLTFKLIVNLCCMRLFLKLKNVFFSTSIWFWGLITYGIYLNCWEILYILYLIVIWRVPFNIYSLIKRQMQWTWVKAFIMMNLKTLTWFCHFLCEVFWAWLFSLCLEKRWKSFKIFMVFRKICCNPLWDWGYLWILQWG